MKTEKVNKLKTAQTKLGNEICLLAPSNFLPQKQEVSLVIGVFHGDEPQGKFLIDEYLKNYPTSKSLISRWKRNRGERSLLFIPCLNPDGMQLNQRTNANRVDLNRNFPTKNWGEDTSKAGNNPADYFGGKSAGSEIETQFVIDVIRAYQPKSILTLHAPYKVVNFDGPAKELAQKISDIIKYPVEESIGYPTPGSFGTYAGIERQIPTITLELDETCPVENLIKPVHEIFDELL